jgi:hypothetical protein
VLAALPDVLGSTIGNMAARGVSAKPKLSYGGDLLGGDDAVTGGGGGVAGARYGFLSLSMASLAVRVVSAAAELSEDYGLSRNANGELVGRNGRVIAETNSDPWSDYIVRNSLDLEVAKSVAFRIQRSRSDDPGPEKDFESYLVESALGSPETSGSVAGALISLAGQLKANGLDGTALLDTAESIGSRQESILMHAGLGAIYVFKSPLVTTANVQTLLNPRNGASYVLDQLNVNVPAFTNSLGVPETLSLINTGRSLETFDTGIVPSVRNLRSEAFQSAIEGLQSLNPLNIVKGIKHAVDAARYRDDYVPAARLVTGLAVGIIVGGGAAGGIRGSMGRVSRAAPESSTVPPVSGIGKATLDELAPLTPSSVTVTFGKAAERAGGSVIIATERGVAMTPELLSLQGTSKIVGNFRGIQGARVEEIISRVPGNWTLASQQKGMGIRFLDEAGIERLRLHGPSAGAPAGSNSAAGWTARIHVPGTKNSYYDSLGNIVGPKANEGHIPIYGNPNAGY